MDTYELFSLYILPLFKIILKTPLFRNTNHKTYISKERCFYKVITRFYFTFIFIVDFLLLPSVANAVILIVFPFAFLCTLTTPFWFTVANLELFDFHNNFLFACLVANIFAFNFNVLPAFSSSFHLSLLSSQHLSSIFWY